MTLQDLKDILDAGRFHHATYRNFGTVWEGLHIYVIDPKGMRGFSLAGSFNRRDPNLKAAEDMVAHTGVSIGAFGEG